MCLFKYFFYVHDDQLANFEYFPVLPVFPILSCMHSLPSLYRHRLQHQNKTNGHRNGQLNQNDQGTAPVKEKE